MTDDAIEVPGSVPWLGEMVKIAMTSTDATRRRFWAASDEVARLRRDLSAAEERLAIVEREYNAEGKFTHEIWGQLRDELTNARRVSTDDAQSIALPPTPAIVRVTGGEP